MVRRFVAAALNKARMTRTNDQLVAIVVGAAEELGIHPALADHLIWRAASGRPPRGADAAERRRSVGHATAAETLDTYSHLWPDSDDRTREAVDSRLTADSRPPADYLRTIGGA